MDRHIVRQREKDRGWERRAKRSSTNRQRIEKKLLIDNGKLQKPLHFVNINNAKRERERERESLDPNSKCEKNMDLVTLQKTFSKNNRTKK